MDPTAQTNDDAPPPPSRRASLLRVLAWSVGAALLIATASWRIADLARARALADLREVDSEAMRLVVSNLRMELEKLELVPRLVARDERIERLLRSPGAEGLTDVANRYLEEVNRTVGALDTYVMDVNGLTLAASNWSSDSSFVGESFGFRPYFQDALEGRNGRYFARGAASLKRGYYFACPIYRADEIIGVAAVKVGFEGIERAWMQLPGPILLTDWHGIAFATNEPLWLYRSLRPMDAGALEAVVESRRYPGVTLDPTPLVTVEPIDGTTSLMTVLSAGTRNGPGRGRSHETYLALSDDLPEYGWMVYTMSSLAPVKDSVRLAAALGALSAGLLVLSVFYFAQQRQHRRQRALFAERERRALQRNQEELERRIEVRTADLVRINQQLQQEITEHQSAQRALRETQQGLVQSAKLAALGQLATGVTHELNQPLTALRSYADNARLLIERDRLGEAAQNLERIVRLTDRMAEMTRHLKTFARKTEPGEQQNVNIVRALDAALSLVGVPNASHNIDLFYAAPTEALLVVGDPIRLEQVFVNLIKNAREALMDSDLRELHIDYRASNQSIEVEIRDTGPGIPDSQLASVFDPFFTTKEAGEGLGLGLSISSGILSDMQGSIRAHNHPDGGAVFTVELPRARANVRTRSA